MENILNLKSYEWFRNTQHDINNKTNSSLYVYYDVPPGRLGNLLFGFASTFGIAHHCNRQFAYKADLKRLNHLLPNLNLNKTAPTSWIKWTKMQEKKMLYFDERFFNLPETNVTIGGYLQSFKYFENVSEEIFKTYSDINQQLLEKVKSFKESVNQEARKRLSYHSPTTVCLHVRRGDFITKRLVDAGHKVPTSEELHFATNWMERKFKRCFFCCFQRQKLVSDTLATGKCFHF